MLTDTHAHIHFDEFRDDLLDVFKNAASANVEKIICVGTDVDDSRKALNFVQDVDVVEMAGTINLYATAGIHPHSAGDQQDDFVSLSEIVANIGYRPKLVAIGECGLDYYKSTASKKDQYVALEKQLDLAMQNELPVVFHVRDAWEDFFAILKNYPKVRGIIHSFTGHSKHVEQAGVYDLYFGLNGIMTFTKDEKQLAAARLMPETKVVLETDCPYLAPSPYRGKRNEPSYIAATARFLADLREEREDIFVKQTSQNAKRVFGL